MRILFVNLINQILGVLIVLQQFPAPPYVVVTSPLHEIISVWVVLSTVKYAVNFPFL
jgi:hypothetical protein